jgi:hypothetical protein
MFIRIKPGEAYSYTVDKFPDRKYQQLLPVPLERWRILDLRAEMTPEQWYVYCTLLWYEQVKQEVKTPTLNEIWNMHCSKQMTIETFNEVIESLQKLYYKQNNELIPILKFETGVE